MDLNHILLFIAVVSPLVILARLRRAEEGKSGWRIISLAILFVTLACWLFFPNFAGYLGGGFWFAFLFLPALGLRRVADLTAQQRYTEARRLINLSRFLHPIDDVAIQARLLRALELAHRGEIEAALARLAALRSDATVAGRQATIQIFQLKGDWRGLLSWCRALPPEIFLSDYGLLPVYFRAQGEINALDDLVLQFAARAQVLGEFSQAIIALNFSLLSVFAFCGRTRALVRLLNQDLFGLPQDIKEFWIGTAELMAGNYSAGRARLEQLITTSDDEVIREDCRQRLNRARENTAVALAPGNKTILRRLEQKSFTKHPSLMSHTIRVTPVVLTFILLNTAMFLIESALGGSTNELTLHRLGALEPAAVIFRGEYWRLLTALFLHYGAIHLFFNLYALYVLGPALENSIGAIRFGACYLISGIGSSVGVVVLRVVALTTADQLVGASGSVMGVVGAWIGFLLRHRHLPTAAQRLRTLFIILLMQTAFDLWTPQVSMAAHLSGLTTGLIAGFFLAPRRKVELREST